MRRNKGAFELKREAHDEMLEQWQSLLWAIKKHRKVMVKEMVKERGVESLVEVPFNPPN